MGFLLAVRFLAELGLLAALAWGGWARADGGTLSVVLAVGLPLVAAVVWGLWVAPRSGRRLMDPARLTIELGLFTVALLVVLGAGWRGAWFGVAVWVAFLVSLPARRVEV